MALPYDLDSLAGPGNHLQVCPAHLIQILWVGPGWGGQALLALGSHHLLAHLALGSSWPVWCHDSETYVCLGLQEHKNG